MFLLPPLFALGMPMGLSQISQSCAVYRALSDRGVTTSGRIVDMAETGGKVVRVVVTSSFVAADGRRYLSGAQFYRSETYRMRRGDSISVIYDRDNPGINAVSLAAARGDIRSAVFLVMLGAGALALILWMFRDDYRVIYQRMRRLADAPA